MRLTRTMAWIGAWMLCAGVAGAASLREPSLSSLPLAPSFAAEPVFAPLYADGPSEAASGFTLARRENPRESGAATPLASEIFTVERARALLRSLTVPGWGQARAGHSRSATVFALAEVGIWTSFTACRIQEQMRKQSYERTARILAGIDLRGRDEEFRRIVGSFLSSDEYNQLVVYRDAANLYYEDPVEYRRYIAEHSLGGSNTWSWASEADLLRYRSQRKRTQRVAQRADAALAAAVVNRLLSALHAARVASGSHGPGEKQHSWKLEASPSNSADATAFRFGLTTRF